MPIVYSRDIPKIASPDNIARTVQHVIDHCRSIAAADDDPTNDVLPVQIDVHEQIQGDMTILHIVGTVDAEPTAPYLREDFDPDEDEQANPLSDEYLERRDADERSES